MSRNSGNRSGEGEGEEKEQCSPVSILDPPFEDYDGNKSRDAEEDDYDHECTYENVQRAKNQLLYRLSRFEKLAELDPMELERKLLDGSDDEELNCDDEAFEARNMKKLVSDLIVEENNGTINSGTIEVIMDRINSRFESWKEVEFNMIDTMIGLDLKREFDGWTKFKEGVNESVEEIEVAVLGVLMDELLEELVL